MADAFSTLTALLVSTYIAQERPEGDTLGYWAEIVQAMAAVSLIIGVVVGILALLGVVALGNDR